MTSHKRIPDPTRLPSAEAVLREQDLRYRSLFEQTRDAVFLLDLDGYYVAVNQRATEMLGYSVDELIGMHYRAVVAPQEHQRSSQVFELLKAGKDVPLYERVFRKRSGAEFPVEMNVSLVCDDQGKPIYIQSIVRDITRRKLDEQMLRESEERYRSVIASLAEGVLLVDEDTIVLAANSSAKRILNRPLHRIIGERVTDVWVSEAVHEDGAPFEPEDFPVGLALATGQPQSDVIMGLQQPDSTRIWISVNTQPVIHPGEKRPYQVVVSFFDITARRETAAAERGQRELTDAIRANALAISNSLRLDEVLDRILENIAPAVPHDMANLMLITDGVAQTVRHRGYTERGLSKLTGSGYVIDRLPNFRLMAETRQPLIISDTYGNPNWIFTHHAQWIRSYLGVPVVFQEEVIGFINLDSSEPGAFTEAHAERLQIFANQAAIAVRNAQLYEEVRQHAAELEARNAELDAFSHTVAHDLKAPLQVLIAYANLLEHLLREYTSAEVVDIVQQMPRHAFKMSQIIDSLLLLAGLRDAEVPIAGVAMQPVVEGALMRFKDRIAERNIVVEVQPELPPAVGYGPWLEEVFANLIGNAIKYIGNDNPAPQIAIRGERLGSMARYEVVDNGLGIDQEHQRYLFKMFARFHKGESKGHGLGLSIVHRIIVKLNGVVGVESEPEEGSTFWFTLPALDLDDE